MDFKKILQRFDAAEDTNSAKSLITGTSNKNTMKAILESLDGIDEASPNDPLAVRIKRAYGAFFDRGDTGLDYLDDRAPLYNQLFDKHGFDFDKVIAHEPDQVLAKLADELESVLDSMQFDLEESKDKKPDFPDIDDDGNREESMEKAAADKLKKKNAAKNKKEKVDEAIMVSAEGSEAESLLQILKLSGMSTPAPAAPPAPAPVGGSSYDSGPLPALPAPEDDMDMDMDMDMQDEYSNSPDEFEQDIDAVIASGNDLHRDKDQYPATAPGDNPMRAFEGKFKAILDELLAEDDDKKKDFQINEESVSDDELEEIALAYLHDAKMAIAKMAKSIPELAEKFKNPRRGKAVLEMQLKNLEDEYKRVSTSKTDVKYFASRVESLLYSLHERLTVWKMPFEAEEMETLRAHIDSILNNRQ